MSGFVCGFFCGMFTGGVAIGVWVVWLVLIVAERDE